jgi:hypothetical protein
MTKLTYHLSKILPLIGKECIYKDSSSIRLARMVELHISSNSIDFILEFLTQDGFTKGTTEPCAVSCTLEYLRINKGYLHASIVNWTIFVDPDEVDHLISFAKNKPSTQEFLDELRKFRKPSLPCLSYR